MSGISWVAWRLTEEGGLLADIRIEREGKLVRERRRFESVEAAASELGGGFGEVVRRALEAKSRAGRWRP